MITKIEQWEIFELDLKTEQYVENPYISTEIVGYFKNGNSEKKAHGYYTGEKGQYKLRFMAENIGEYTIRIKSNLSDLDDLEFGFICIENCEDKKGPVIVTEQYHFKYSSGENFYPFGTTSYVWNYQSKEMQSETLKSLKKSPFNKLRMCIFPKYYHYNLDSYKIAPFKEVKDTKEIKEYNRDLRHPTKLLFNPEKINYEFFDELEEQIIKLADLGIQVDLILFHPYDRWGYAQMGEYYDKLYLKYIVSRFGAFSNIWWSMANEYDLLENYGQKSYKEFTELIKYTKSIDPYDHLMSIHNWYDPYYHYTNNSHWYAHDSDEITHLSLQHSNLDFIPFWKEKYRKPLVIDECRYEGNLDLAWGNMTAKGMVTQFWKAICSGAYCSHGETYKSEKTTIWWAHGGKLIGESVERIRFLKDIVEREKLQITQVHEKNAHWETIIGKSNNQKYLIFCGENSQSSAVQLEYLDEGNYRVEIYDTWNMKLLDDSQIASKDTFIKLPQMERIALLLLPI